MPEPLPIALCGKHPSMAKPFIEQMLPEYDVVHVSHTPQSAKLELPALLSGEPILPSSSLGSNTSSPKPRVPQAVFVGGGFSTAEVEEMRAVEELKKVPWLVAVPRGSVPPKMDWIVGRCKEVFGREGFVEGWAGGGEGEVWEFYGKDEE